MLTLQDLLSEKVYYSFTVTGKCDKLVPKGQSMRTRVFVTIANTTTSTTYENGVIYIYIYVYMGYGIVNSYFYVAFQSRKSRSGNLCIFHSLRRSFIAEINLFLRVVAYLLKVGIVKAAEADVAGERLCKHAC
jgi:hypothetical protein